MAQETEGHLLNELFNADLAFKNCDSTRTAYKMALVKCKEIPNIDTGIDDIINDIKNHGRRSMMLVLKKKKIKGIKKPVSESLSD